MERRKQDMKFRAACGGADVKEDEQFLDDEALMRRMDALVAAQNAQK